MEAGLLKVLRKAQKRAPGALSCRERRLSHAVTWTRTAEEDREERAFDLVDPSHAGGSWKMPIKMVIAAAHWDAVLKAEGLTERDVIQAVINSTGGVLTTERENGNVHLEAPGYYACIGA